MDALDLLISDHNRVKELFEQIQGERGMQQKRLLFENIRLDLETHAYVEETVFYPEFGKRPGFEELVEVSYKEHSEIKTALADLDLMNVDHPNFDTKLGELVNDVLSHI
ncbi:MAG: hemerythrin domain-containing protein, partial [Bdellovibrionota bacterium]